LMSARRVCAWAGQNPDTLARFNSHRLSEAAFKAKIWIFSERWWWALKGSNLRPAD
jgi:hypothetical protein